MARKKIEIYDTTLRDGNQGEGVNLSLADKLDGELLDEQGTKLSIQRERYLREEVVQFEHELR